MRYVTAAGPFLRASSSARQSSSSTVCFGWSKHGVTHTERLVFGGDRQAVRSQTVVHALQGLLRFLD